MEHGTEWEREAVRARWRSMEARRRGTDRLLLGLQGVLLGVALLILVDSHTVCTTTISGATTDCAAVAPQFVVIGLGMVGVMSLEIGAWVCWDGLQR